jgi:hypothetical protein
MSYLPRCSPSHRRTLEGRRRRDKKERVKVKEKGRKQRRLKKSIKNIEREEKTEKIKIENRRERREKEIGVIEKEDNGKD